MSEEKKQMNNHRSKPDKAKLPLSDTLIDLRNVTKRYESMAGTFAALSAVNFQAQAGEFVAVVGKSGSGKSTLLNILSGIDSPTSGEVIISGTTIQTFNQ